MASTPDSETHSRFIRIRLIDGSQLNGQINLNRDPGFTRLSDLISSRRERFLTLTNVTVYGHDFQIKEKKKVLFINKTHIMWAEPNGEE